LVNFWLCRHLARRADLETPASLKRWLARLVRDDPYYADDIPLEPRATGHLDSNPIIITDPPDSQTPRITIKSFVDDMNQPSKECRVKIESLNSKRRRKVIDHYFRPEGIWVHVEFTTPSEENPEFEHEGPGLMTSTILSLHINATQTAYVPVSFLGSYAAGNDLAHVRDFCYKRTHPG